MMKNTEKILRIVLGKLKVSDKDNILSEMETNPEMKEEYRKIKNVSALISSKKEMDEYKVEELYLNFRKQLDSRKKKSTVRYMGILKYAAVFVLAFGIASLIYFNQLKQTSSAVATHSTAVFAENGQISKVVLPDSTIVWLNSGTKVVYNSLFGITNRDIQLVGQAFLDVTKNKELPLRVLCDDFQVNVLGTRFDVSAYPEDGQIHVFLERGKVELSKLNDETFVYSMDPGEFAEYDKTTGKVLLEKTADSSVTLWKDGVLVFKDGEMSEVLSRLKRKYNIDIEVLDADVYNSVFNATIKNESLDEIFGLIAYACSIDYKIEKPTDTARKKKVILEKAN
ncbi:FecR family protein [Sunxiuqinia sp. A32]|uniref:FecR family protein n=1 Tax=Sunxiuqinia sp. A32 TaxID=3461496 RepID=UPI0040462E2D